MLLLFGPQIVGENRDQGEAIGTMMDMLEKTMTAEDATLMVDDLNNGFGARIDEHSVEFEHKLQLREDGLVQAIGVAKEQLEAVFEARLAEVEADRAAESAQQAERVVKLEVQIEEAEKRHDKRAAELKEHMGKFESELTAQTLKELELVRSTMDVLSADVESRTASLEASVTAKVSAMQARADLAIEGLQATLVETQDSLERHVKGLSDDLEASLAGMSETLTGQIREVDEKHTAATMRIEARVNEEAGALGERLAAEIGATNGRFAEDVANLQDTVRSSVAKLDSAVNGLDGKLDQAVEDLNSSVGKQCEEMDGQLRGFSGQVDGSLEDLRGLAETLTGEVQKFVVEAGLDKEITHAAISRVDSKFETVTELWTEVEQQSKHFTQLTTANHTELSEALAKQKSEATEQAAKSTTLCNKLDQTLADNGRLQDARITELATSTRERCDGLTLEATRVQNSLDSRVTTCERAVDTTLARAKEVAARLELAVENANRATAEKVESEGKRVKLLTENLEKTLHEALQSVRDDARAGRAALGDKFDKSEAGLAETVTNLEAKQANTHARHELKLDTSHKESRELQQAAAKLGHAVDELEKAAEADRLEVQNVIELTKGELAGQLKASERSAADANQLFDVKVRDLASSVAEMQVSNTNRLASLQGKLSDFKTGSEAATTELQRNLAELHMTTAKSAKDFSSWMGSTDSRIATEVTKLDTRLTESVRTQAEGEKSLKESISFNKAATEQRGENMRTHLMGKLEFVEGKFTDRHAALEKKVEEVRSEAVLKIESLEAHIEAEGRRHTAAEDSLRSSSTELAGTVSEHRKQLSGSISELERAVATEKTSVAHQLEDCRSLSAREHSRINKAIAAAGASTKERLEEIDSRLTRQCDDRLQEHAALQKTVAGDTLGLQKQVRDLGERVDAQAPDLAEQISTVRLKLASVDTASQRAIKELEVQASTAEQKVASLAEGCNASIAESEVAAKALLTSEIVRVTAAQKTLENAIEMQVGGLSKQLASTVPSQEAQLVSMQKLLSGADEGIMQDIRNLKDTVEDNQTSARSMADAFNKKVTGVLDMHASRITAQQHHIDDVSRTLEMRTSEKNVKQDSRVDELAGSQLAHHKHFTEITMRLESLFTDKNTEQNSRTEGQFKQLQDRLHRADVRSSEQDNAHDIKLEDLNVVVHDNNQRLHALCTNIDAQTTEAYNALDARLKAKNDHFSDVLALLTEDVEAKHTLLENKIGSAGTKLELGFKDLFSKYDTMGKAQDLKDRGQDDRIDQNYDHLSTLLKELDRRTVDKHYELMAKLDLVGRTSEDSLQQHSEALKNTDSILTKRCANTDLNMERHRVGLLERLDGSESALDEKLESFFKRLDLAEQENAKQIATQAARFDRSDRQLEKSLANTDEKIVRQREHIDEVAMKVHSLLIERLEDQEKSWRETCEEVDKTHHAQFHTQAEDFDRLRVQLRTDQAELSSSVLQLETRLEHRIAQQLTKLEEQQTLFSRLCEESLQATAGVATAGEKRAVAAEEMIEKHYLELGGQTAELARHFEGADDRILFCTDTTNAFAEKLDGQHATFTEACLKLNTSIVALHTSHEANATGLAATKAELGVVTAPLNQQLLQLERDGRSWQTQCADDFATTGTKLDEQHQVFTDACLKLNEAILALHTGHEATIAGLASLRTEAEGSAVATRAVLTEQQAAITEVGKALRQEASRAGSRLMDLATDITAREERLARQATHIAENAADDVQRTLDKLDRQHQTFSSACLKLNDGLVSLDASQLAGNQALDVMRDDVRSAVGEAAKAAQACLDEFEEQLERVTQVQENMAMSAALRDMRVSELESAATELDDRIFEGVEGPDGAVSRLDEMDVDNQLAELTVGL